MLWSTSMMTEEFPKALLFMDGVDDPGKREELSCTDSPLRRFQYCVIFEFKAESVNTSKKKSAVKTTDCESNVV